MLLPTVVYWENGTAVILPELLLDGGICTWGFWKDHPFRNFKDENGWVHKKCEKSLEFPRAIIGFRRQAVNFRSQQVFCKAPLKTEAVWTFLLKTHQPTLCQVPWLWHRFVFCLGIFCRIPMYGIRVKLMKIYINRWWNLVTWLINQDCFPTLKSMIIRACTKVILSFFSGLESWK